MQTISHWCGRFGNNIQQLTNAIYFCRKNSLIFKSPEHEFIKSFEIKFGDFYAPSSPYFFHTKSVWEAQGGPHFDLKLDELKKQRREIALKYIYPNLKFNTEDIAPLEQSTVVTHIRSGDIFSRENYYHPIVSRSIQNPLSYYLNIFKNYSKIIIVTEPDTNNPVVEKLKEDKSLIFKICSLEETIKILLAARNIVTSGVSSFPIGCGLLSKNLERVHVSNFFLEEVINHTDLEESINVHTHIIDTNKYLKLDEWRNTKEQRDLLLTYGLK